MHFGEEESVFSVYPNPTTGLVNLQYFNGDNNTITLKVINSVGQIISVENIFSDQSLISTILVVFVSTFITYLFRNPAPSSSSKSTRWITTSRRRTPKAS